MSQWQLNFNCQISVIHQAAKQHNAVARIAGALLAFFCQGINKKKWSLPLVPFITIIYYNRCGQFTFAVGRLSAIRYKKANWSACSAGYIMGKLCEFQHYHLAILRAKKGNSSSNHDIAVE